MSDASKILGLVIEKFVKLAVVEPTPDKSGPLKSVPCNCGAVSNASSSFGEERVGSSVNIKFFLHVSFF